VNRLAWPLSIFGAFLVGALSGALVENELMSQEGVNEAPSSATRFVTGIGGVFFKADNPQRLRAWYREHLGVEAESEGVNFFWRNRDYPEQLGFTVWSVFPKDTDYFGAEEQDLMIDYRVRNLDALLEKLRAQGVHEVREREQYDYGQFAWILDGEGNRIELWEPAGP
jgi:catechol 2,3-dioxygenase-like lactoylglutathione lyase family enzyme